MSALGEFNVPLLYRHILKAAKQFPSIKRGAIVQEIQTEFHANKALSNNNRIMEERKRAVEGLQQLAEYCNMQQTSSEWSVNLKGACP